MAFSCLSQIKGLDLCGISMVAMLLKARGFNDAQDSMDTLLVLNAFNQILHISH